MNKIILSGWFLLFQFGFVNAQTYGNEWINFSQKYYTFKISASGIHRINYATLQAANIPLSSFTHENMQLFGREREVPIWIETNGDNSFDDGDYLLFYADKNDGWIDSLLYVEPDKIGNPGYSLFNDSINYYFTWNNQTTNLRFESETDVDFSSYSPASFVWDDFVQSYNTTYQQGEKIDIISSSFYVAGEGYGRSQSNGAGTGVNITFTAQTPFPFTGAGAPQSNLIGHTITTSNANASDNIPNHHTRFRVGGQTVDDQLSQGYKLVKTDVDFPTNFLGNTTPVIWSIVGDLPVLTDFQALNYWKIRYPRLTNFSAATKFDVFVENSSQAKIRLDITNLNVSNPILFSLDPLAPKKLTLENNGGVFQTLIPNSLNGVNQRIVFGNLNNVIQVSSITPVSSTGFFTNFSTLNYEEALLMVYHENLQASSVNYQNYRQSMAGGSYNAILIDVDQLYHQFGAGIEKHILAIRRFALYAYDQATSKPVGLYLMAKGVSNSLTRTSAASFANSLIPTWGVPASDVFITSNLPGTSKWTPLIPTGRISVNNNIGLQKYLTKIIAYEEQQVQSSVYNSATKDWQKHVIHLVGGTTASQQLGFQAYMNFMKDTIQHQNFAGVVHTIKRDNDDPIPPGQLSDIMQRIEDGVSLMTYYGHYGIGENGFEINLDDVTTWNNLGKYPLMLVNSCYNGDIFKNSSTSSSEYFVNAHNVGAIGYISSVSTGFHPFVGQYSTGMYHQFGRKTYGETIGTNMQKNIESLEPVGHLYQEMTCAQMVLNGDPMLKVNYHNKPEIELLEQYVSFKPNEVDLTTDSIEVIIALKNLGKSIIDTFNVEIRRNFPGSDIDSLYFIPVYGLNYTDTIKKKLPLQSSISVGLNVFDVKVDIPSFVDEQFDELLNNRIIKSYFLDVDGILPVVPYAFAVVPSDSITLKASTINPLAAMNSYRFQIDTTDLFNSPFLKNAVVSGLGGVKEVHPSQWNTPLVLEDSVVYFWRVAIDEAVPNWKERSFQYIPGRSGWGQDHFFQFKNNNFSNINYNRDILQREWQPDSTVITCDVLTSASFSNAWYLNGTLQDYSVCGTTPSIHVAVVEPSTMQVWGTNYNNENPQHVYGNVMGCRSRVEKYFIFRQNSLAQLQAFQNMVLNEVPDGYYLLIYTPITTRYDQWNALDSSDMYQTFASLGANQIVPGLANSPFIYFSRKGYPTTIQESIVNTSVGENTTSITGYILGSETTGQESSQFIGPSLKWGNVYWKQETLDLINNTDTTRLLIQAYNQEKQFAFETNILFTANDSLLNLNTLVDANLYPYIRLKAIYKDTTNLTPAQMDRWHVLYDLAPEAAIEGSTIFASVLNGDEIKEGQEVSFAVDIRNIFSVDMDSLLINYWIEDANQQVHYINYPRQDSLKVNETLRDTITFSTTGYAGLNLLRMEVNPYINGSLIVTDQPEQEHFNNVLQIPFFVNSDDENPILDVTFNGRHILNGDIIDPKSEVYITLKDDNPFLIMDNISDTTLFGIYLTYPNGTQKRISFMDAAGNTIMQWIPAEAQNKRFKIIYPAMFEQDGKYKLLVQGSDRSGNVSGDFQYAVTFEVIHASSITQMMNYPNPFSTSTRFVFTLTGSEVPDDIIIQIMTVSGRVVREITEDQLGPIYIGRNITEYAWDGRDEFGDPLANGVYLYNVRAKINGENIEQRESGADQYFKKNFGKMYLMR